MNTDSDSDKENLQIRLQSNTPPKKKPKRLVTFNPKWRDHYEWLRQSSNENSACCVICNMSTFSIGHGGEHDLQRHMQTKKQQFTRTAICHLVVAHHFFQVH